MQQAIPFRSWQTPNTHAFNICNRSSVTVTTEGMVRSMVSENAVIVFARRGCCMSHVAKRLLLGLGVNPAVYEVEENEQGGVVRELEAAVGSEGNCNKVQFPAVFIGGKLFGGLERLMAIHISGDLVPLLKQAGALWL